MKKWLAVLLALVMVLSLFTLTACGDKAEDAGEKQEEKNDGADQGDAKDEEDKQPTLSTYETVEAAAEKLSTLKTGDLAFKGSMKVSAAGEEMTYAADAGIKVAGTEDKPVVGANAKLSMMGQEVTVEGYFADGYVYAVVNGEKMKMAVDLAEVENELKNSLEDAEIDTEALPEFDFKALLNKSTITKDAAGNSVVKVALEVKDAQDYLDKLMKEIAGAAEADGMAKITVKQFDVELALGAGYLSGVSLKAKADVDADGEVGTIELDLDVELKNPGQAVTITPPAGYESFPEMGGDSEDMDASNEIVYDDFSDEL